ncbi:MAG: GNAT family N-acetyltransferase [Pseudobdellovibrionaceae bacterium]
MKESPYSQYIIASHEISQSSTDSRDPSIRTVAANFTKPAGFKKMGVHHVLFPPGARSSLPHAESLEEEFVFVISGNPHVWIDGYVYALTPNCAAGFPAGTGIAHNFINNTNENVELLVLGERTKKENLCSFPVDPEQKEASNIWWADAPQRPLGPHNGEPGPVQPHEIGSKWPECIVDCTQLKRSKGWHYAGDNETFSEYSRLTDPLGLKVFGIGFESLAPGKRSSFPHSHKTEEEFVFVLSGTATIWMNGFAHEAKPCDGVAFLPGTNIAHTVINDSEAPLWYMVIGEASDDANEDRIYYPMHSFRNEQCKVQKYFWEDRPTDLIMGPHSGRPQKQIRDHLCLRHADSMDENLILEIFKKSPGYFLRVDGVEPTLKTVQHAIQDEPEKRTETYRKEFLVVEYQDQPIGVVDIHIHHPEPGMVYIGLLLVTEDLFGKGLGRRIYDLVEHYVKMIFEVKLIRLGVSEDNDVSEFWKKMGFSRNGKTYDWKGEEKTTHVIEFDKQLVKV